MNEILEKRLIEDDVSRALEEDIGSGDITAQLVSNSTTYTVNVISREEATICGSAWVDETFLQVDPSVTLDWKTKDGARVNENDVVFTASGNARAILTAERTALNFLQFLSGVATCSYQYAQTIVDSSTVILDTRKTIPGFRNAQKYAVRCGGCQNHRMGLYDAYLIKENHIAACGSITAAVATAKNTHSDKPVEIEVETLDEFREALTADADIIMLDDMSLDHMRIAVEENGGKCRLEASGNMSIDRLQAVAKTGVDYISIGALTKHLRAIDLSMRFV